MEFIAVDNRENSGVLATLYSEKNYCGESQDMGLGIYNEEQLVIDGIASVKLRANAALTAYESSTKEGAYKFFHEDVPDIRAQLPFAPKFYALLKYVGIFDSDKLVGTLTPGRHETSSLREKGAARLVIPEGLRLTLWNEVGESISDRKTFESGDIEPDESFFAYKYATVTISVSSDEADAIGLTDMELANVSGGCLAHACAAQACALDTSIVQACGAQACGLNIIPIMPVGP